MSNCDLSVLAFSNAYPMMGDKFIFMTKCLVKRNFEINRVYLGLPESNTKMYNQTVTTESCQNAIHNLLQCFNRLEHPHASSKKCDSGGYRGVSIDERFVNTPDQKKLFNSVLENCDLMKEKNEFTRKYNVFK